MAVYSINDLEKLCGIKAHTLRIWEKRYGIIKPKRTESNIRYYLDDDLQKVLNISLLNRKGVKISHIAKMSEEEIRSRVAELSEVSSEFEDNLDSLMFAMLELDEFKFSKILNHHIDSNGFEETMKDVVYPLMDKLSTMWIAGSIKGVHENFVSSIIRNKTITALNNETRQFPESAPRFLIYLSENESHELSLLFLNYLLKKNGINTINLGTQVPLIDVIEGQAIFKADFVFTIFNDSFSDAPLQPYINELSRHLKDCKILISGYQTAAQSINCPKNVQIIKSIEEAKQFALNLVKVKL